MNYSTYRELLRACCQCRTRRDAEEVLDKAKGGNPKFAEANIGYLLGYLSEEERNRLYKLFPSCDHPIFGASFRHGKEPSPKQALMIGWAQGIVLEK